MTTKARSPVLADLEWRGLVSDATNPEELDAHLAEAPRSIYCGFDPTADSLHVGNLLLLLALRRVQLAGHRPVVLVGGGTGLIGDPSGKAGERVLNPEEQVAEWADRLKRQVERFFEFGGGGNAAVLADNYAWLSRLDVIRFLRDVGKHFPLGGMIARESVRSRMGRSGAGMSYTEFSYQVLQAYDFLCLYRQYGCTMQIGGSDQWGNITAGTDLIRRVENATAFGLTLPLVTQPDGTKFGKTESGTVWLDARRTSPYEMYQFWLNTADADVVTFLKYFTFLERPEIEQLARATRTAPEKREAQRALAEKVTALVHGKNAVEEAERISRALFSGNVKSLSESELAQVIRAIHTKKPPAETGVIPVLLSTGLASSKRAARELVTTGAIQINGESIHDPNAPIPAPLYGKYTIVRKGKKTYVGYVV
jgi:tyrosyl-tRNA synthetase